MKSFRSLVAILLLGSVGSSAWAWDLKLCIDLPKVNLYPFRDFHDGRETSYLLFLRSYISTNKNESALLKAYEFSPDGKWFTARINPELKWSDGSAFTTREALDGIIKTLPFRPLGQRVKVLHSEVIDPVSFKIQFESDIENLTGVVREALSTNSRHNRFWPVKSGTSGERSEVLFKFPFRKDSRGLGMEAFGSKILLKGKDSCVDPDMSVFRQRLTGPLDRYTVKSSPLVAEANIQTNTEKLSLVERAQVIRFVREAFADAPKDLGYIQVDSFFLPGEPGHDSSNSWSKSLAKKSDYSTKYRIGFTMPIMREALENYAKKTNVKLELVQLPGNVEGLDALVTASSIENGRHIFMQDALNWPNVRAFMKKAPGSEARLARVAKHSAATLPPDPVTLKLFETQAIKDFSFAPVMRKFSTALTKPGAAVCLDWSSEGEFTFSPKEKCGSDNKF